MPTAGLNGQRERAVDPLLRTGDAAFMLDGAGRIRGWNEAAERLFGQTPDEVLDQPCHQVLGCRDFQGQALCPANCSLLQAIRQGRLPPSAGFLMHHQRGHPVEVSAHLILFPEEADPRALVLLLPSTAGVVQVPPAVAAAAARPPAPDASGAVPGLDLAAALDRLLIATGADAAELFLTAPTSGQLVLAMHRGQAPRAFRQMVRFDPGQGFPGLVAQSRQPVVSLDLSNDERYLRTDVKRQGFRSYLCVPAISGPSFLGSLHITSRRRAALIAPQLPFLMQVARELATALELQRLRAADLVARQPLDSASDAGANLRRVANHALKTLRETAGVDCGALLLLGGPAGTLQSASEQQMPPPIQRVLALLCDPAACPALARHWTVLPSDRPAMASPCCRRVQRHLPTALCVPIELGGQSLGLALLGGQQREPLPTQHLSFLHAAIERTALMIHNAQVALREENEARARAVRSSAPDRPVVIAAADAAPRPTAGTPFLDLRCLGQFTVTRDGLPVPPRQFTRRQSLTLLKILLTRYGKQVHREELMELLWPAADAESANALLNLIVHFLRRGLGPELAPGQPSSFIRTNGDFYLFDTGSPHRLDSQEFLAAADLGARLETDGRPAAALEAYERAIALYAGDFLEDELYSDWCALDREYLRERFLTVLRRAAHRYADQGDVDAAVTCYRRALQTDATLEDVHRALMEAFWSAGRRDEALRQYRECCTVLERELGVTPAPETEALRQRIAADSGRRPVAKAI